MARLNIENILVVEDRESVAYPECHRKGFVPFCKANPKLRVQRLANLWKNVLPVKSAQGYACGFDQQGDQLNTARVTRAVARWMAEAVMPLAVGRPGDNPITLIFDGDIIAEEYSKVFDRVFRDSAWQQALDESYRRRLLPVPSWFKRRTLRAYHYEEMPRLLQEMNSVNSSIKCNFDVKCHFDVGKIMNERRHDTIDELV